MDRLKGETYHLSVLNTINPNADGLPRKELEATLQQLVNHKEDIQKQIEFLQKHEQNLDKSVEQYKMALNALGKEEDPAMSAFRVV